MPTSTTPSGASPPALRLRGLTKRFGELCAVDGVDLTVAAGELFALLGPNGAGKTTLIHCVAGLARADGGELSVFGHDPVADYRITRRLVGLVPQEINFDPFFTPLETLLNQMGLMGIRPDRARAEELLRLVALWDRRDAYTRQLSGGMKRRLLVAKALMHRPRLLFLDEPTAGVDVELRRDLWRAVRTLREEQGVTIILTTHYLEEAEALADRIGVLHRGKLLLTERRDELLARRRERRIRLEFPVGGHAAAVQRELGGDARIEGEVTLVVPWSTAGELERVLRAARRRAEPLEVRFEQTDLEQIFIDLIHAADGQRPGGDR